MIPAEKRFEDWFDSRLGDLTFVARPDNPGAPLFTVSAKDIARAAYLSRESEVESLRRKIRILESLIEKQKESAQ